MLLTKSFESQLTINRCTLTCGGNELSLNSGVSLRVDRVELRSTAVTQQTRVVTPARGISECCSRLSPADAECFTHTAQIHKRRGGIKSSVWRHSAASRRLTVGLLVAYSSGSSRFTQIYHPTQIGISELGAAPESWIRVSHIYLQLILVHVYLCL